MPQTGIIVLSVNKKKHISYKIASILNVSCCFNRNWRTSKSQSEITEGEFFFHLQFHVSYKQLQESSKWCGKEFHYINADSLSQSVTGQSHS